MCSSLWLTINSFIYGRETTALPTNYYNAIINYYAKIYNFDTSRLAFRLVTYIIQSGLTMTEAGAAAGRHSQEVGGGEVPSHHPS